MKTIKKLMAAALVCVMALSMLTGCAVADKFTEKNMVKAMNDAANKSVTYTRTDELDKKAAECSKKAANATNWDGTSTNVGLEGYTLYVGQVPNNWSNTQKQLKDDAGKAHNTLKSCKKTDGKISIGVDVKEINNKNYIFVVAQNA